MERIKEKHCGFNEPIHPPPLGIGDKQPTVYATPPDVMTIPCTKARRSFPTLAPSLSHTHFHSFSAVLSFGPLKALGVAPPPTICKLNKGENCTHTRARARPRTPIPINQASSVHNAPTHRNISKEKLSSRVFCRDEDVPRLTRATLEFLHFVLPLPRVLS